MADSRLCKLSFQLIFVTLSWSTTIAHSFLEPAEEDGFGHVYVFHACDVASPAQLQLKQDGLYAGQAGSFEHFFVRQVVLLCIPGFLWRGETRDSAILSLTVFQKELLALDERLTRSLPTVASLEMTLPR